MRVKRLQVIFFFKILMLLLFVTPSYGSENLIFSTPIAPIDTSGKKINAHGGDIIKYKNYYYWYGEDKNAGSRAKSGVHVYRSQNLQDWQDLGLALRVSPSPNSDITSGAIIERPKVLYNEKNKNFVMFFHLEKKGKGYSSALIGLAKSNTPEGPFLYSKSFRLNNKKLPINKESFSQLKKPENFIRDFNVGQMSRDMTVFKDDNDIAYLVSSSEGNSTLIITKLNGNYDGLTSDFVRVAPGDYNEAPVVLKRNNKYFIISSGSTGWDPNEARLYESTSMLGSWIKVATPIRSKNSNDVKYTFGGQGAFSFSFNDRVIFVLDIWNKADLKESKYLFIPIKWDSASRPFLMIE